MNKNVLFTTTDLTKWWWVWRKISLISKYLKNNWIQNYFLWYYDIWEKYEFYWEYNNRKEKLVKNKLFFPFSSLYKLFSRAYHMAKFCKKNNISTVFSFWEKANYPALISKIIFKNKAKIITQKTVDLSYFDWIENKLMKLYNYTDNLIVLSNKTKLDLVNKFWIKEEKIKVFKNPIDLKYIDTIKNEDLDNNFEKELLNNWKFTLINVWRFTDQKNHKLLISSFKLLVNKYWLTDIQLILVWWWEKEEQLKEFIKNNNLENQIYILWFKWNPFKYLNKSNLFVLSSRYEWLPNAVLDAMSVWLPIISVDCPTWPKELLSKEEKDSFESFKEIKEIQKEEYGILVPNYNEEKLAKAIYNLYNDKQLLNNYKEKSLEKIKQFDLNIVWKEYLKLTK